MWFVQRPVITKRRQTPPQIENKWGGISLLRLVQVMSHLTCRVMFFFVCLPLCWPRQLHEHDKEFPHVQCGIELCACVLHSDLSKPLFSLTVSMCSIDEVLSPRPPGQCMWDEPCRLTVSQPSATLSLQFSSSVLRQSRSLPGPECVWSAMVEWC